MAGLEPIGAARASRRRRIRSIEPERTAEVKLMASWAGCKSTLEPRQTAMAIAGAELDSKHTVPAVVELEQLEPESV